MARAPNLDIEFYDGSLRDIINMNGSDIKRQIRSIIQRASIIVCLIGNGTAWREWVEWEAENSHDLHKGLCGIRLKDTGAERLNYSWTSMLQSHDGETQLA